MTALKLATRLRKYTKQNTTTLSDADALDLLNAVKDDLAEQIASRDLKGNYFIVPATDNLIASQREYAWADDQLDHIYSIEFAFSNQVDEFGELTYILAKPDDFRKWGVGRTEMNIQSRYGNSKGRVCYEIQRRAIYLLSGNITSTTLLDVNGNAGAASVTNGIRLRYRAYPVDLTALTDNTNDLSVDPTNITFGFPRQFHELWARKAAIDWKAQHPGAVPQSQLDAMYPSDLEEKLEAMNNPDLSGETIGTLPLGDGHNSDGYDL